MMCLLFWIRCMAIVFVMFGFGFAFGSDVEGLTDLGP